MQMTVVAGTLFALVCYAVALQGLLTLGELQGDQLSDAKGFAAFWGFLGSVCAGLAALAWWLSRGASSPPPSGG